MDSSPNSYDQIVERFVRWAQGEKSIRAAILIGSRARKELSADQWSDLDLILILTEPQRFLSRTDWLEKIGVPRLTFLEGTSTGGEMERRVLFEGGLDVDFAVIPERVARGLIWYLRIQRSFPVLLRLFPRFARRMEESTSGFFDIIRRGVRVLVDKDGLAVYLDQAAGMAHGPSFPPGQPEFLEVVNDFWYHTLWTAKHLRRGELWWAKSCCDDRLKWLLRRMMEWHARATKGPQYDTWMRGRFLETWADPRAVKELKGAFAHYDEQDIWHALQATMDLFRWLSLETAERLAFPYPTAGADSAVGLVKKLFSERS
jgi:aminoglycoside 6-adenylyltransferase